MSLSGERIYVGFGFGPIQTGLFLYEAFNSGNFSRLLVVEVNSELVSAVQHAGGKVNLNIAHADHLEVVEMTGIELYDPANRADREIIIEQIADAAEIGTAVPSVKFYTNETPGSIHRLIAQGLIHKIRQGGPACVVYAAENHIKAAEILRETIHTQMPQALTTTNTVQYLNTVIGKMSQVVNLSQIDNQARLAPLVVGYPKAVLVESFNQILVSKITEIPDFSRGIDVFQEKSNLQPFEEVKLYGHNAVHAALGYLAACLSAETISELRDIPGLMAFIRSIFFDEIGTGLCKKFNHADNLFTLNGFNAYAEDLLSRMVNPLLMDSVSRVTRDVNRKLGWDDRLIGALRLCMQQGIEPNNLAFAVAAALYHAAGEDMDKMPNVINQYREKWMRQSTNPRAVEAVHKLVNHGVSRLIDWQRIAFSPEMLKALAGPNQP